MRELSGFALFIMLFICGCGPEVVDEGPPPGDDAAEMTEEDVASERDLSENSGVVEEDL
jgi:hypothetical protein